MCKFFTFSSDPNKPIYERFLYMNWDIRKKILTGALNYEADSHTSIAHYHGYTGEAEDKLNKYEYNPLLDKFVVDQINHHVDDRAEAEKWVHALDFKKVVELLILKPIINPFKIVPPEITSEVLELLRQWASVWASVGDSVRDSVWDSVWASVGGSVWDSVWASVWASAWASVRDSVWASVWASAWAYTSSFLEIKFKFDLSPTIKLWEMGLVPHFDGRTWKIHGGEKGEVLWEGNL